MKIVVYPGTFNPITNGHTDLVNRAAQLFDKVIVAIATSPHKLPSVDIATRVELAQEVLKDTPNVEVCSYNTLTTDFVREKGADIILRGLRTVADFEYEFQLVNMNRVLDEGLETVFLAPSEHCSYISSTLVRQIAAYGGDISKFVHPLVVESLHKEYQVKE